MRIPSSSGEVPMWHSEAGSLQLGVAHILVDGLPADPVVTGKDSFRNTAVSALDQLGRPLRWEGLFPPFVGAALLGQGDAFPLPFPDQGPFEFSEGAHDGEHEVGHGGVLTGEEQVLLDELHPHPFTGQPLHQSTQVIKVPCQPVHAVHHDGVPVTGEPQQLRELRSGRVPARGLSVNTRSRTWPSSWRFSFWSRVLTRTYPIRCPATDASKPVDLSA